jgi:hypothetical protein
LLRLAILASRLCVLHSSSFLCNNCNTCNILCNNCNDYLLDLLHACAWQRERER